MSGWKRKIVGTLCACLLFAVMLEISLRLLGPRLPYSVGNALVRTYTTSVGGMYVFDGVTKVNFCLPNHSQRALYNGYYWHHQADFRGFRNPPNTASEVVLLGDSYIYGHGVEEPDTLAALLRNQHGWKVYNLARQGDSLYQQYVLFRLFYAELKPRKIILFPIVNDFGDIATVRSQAELAQPPEFNFDYEALRKRLDDPTVTRQVGGWWDSFYSYRLFDYARRHQRAPEPLSKIQQTQTQPLLDDKLKTTVGAYYEKLFVDMLRTCQQDHTELEVVYINIDVPDSHWVQGEQIFGDYLEDLCRRHGVTFRNTRELFKGHPEMTLPNDFHLSPQGHRALADWLTSQPSALPATNS